MFNVKNIGGGTANAVSAYYTEKGGKALRLVSFSGLPIIMRGGLRWYKGVTPYG